MKKNRVRKSCDTAPLRREDFFILKKLREAQVTIYPYYLIFLPFRDVIITGISLGTVFECRKKIKNYRKFSILDLIFKSVFYGSGIQISLPDPYSNFFLWIRILILWDGLTLKIKSAEPTCSQELLDHQKSCQLSAMQS